MLTGGYSRTGGELRNTLHSHAGPEQQILGTNYKQIEDQRVQPVVPPHEIQQDAPILKNNDDDLEFEPVDKIEITPLKSRTAKKLAKSVRNTIKPHSARGGLSTSRQTVSNLFNGAPVEDSHPECEFCASQFDLLDQSQCLIMKKKMLRQSTGADRDKEEVFFRMCLLSFQLTNKSNQKVLALDSKSLYEEAAKKRKLPFFKWNDWLRKQIERMQFEHMYKKKTEFEYAKRLAERYEVREQHF